MTASEVARTVEKVRCAVQEAFDKRFAGAISADLKREVIWLERDVLELVTAAVQAEQAAIDHQIAE